MTLVDCVLLLLLKAEMKLSLTLGQNFVAHRGLSNSFFDLTVDQPWEGGIMHPFLRCRI